ncbi:mitochondrial glycine transporter A-like isoform X1 [Onthophagus taurus]|uniref:mitochondrial glycine transporter A-like isoform X1 n=1 Tax=Onthophagus taurus TaxID=166361 RepID=UPI0039BDC062
MKNDQKLGEKVAPEEVSEKSKELSNKKWLENYPVLKAFLAGSLSGTCSTVLFQPLDLVKTRLQNPATNYINGRNGVGMVTIFTNIIQKEQIKGLWKGMTPSLSRCVPGVGLYFCTLDVLKTNFFSDTTPRPLESIGLGVVSRCISGIIMIPMTVIKTRFESGVYGYQSVNQAIKEIYRTEGLKGMTCGLVPTLIRDAPYSGLYLMFYTECKKLVPKDLYNSPYTSPVHFTCGLTAGILSSIVTQPADVLKTKMQLYPHKFSGIWSVIVYVNTKYGVRGYFKGVVPRMLRRTLVTAMAWTVYERLTNTFGLK